MIDPAIWEDECFGKLDPISKILFIGLFSNADDEGIIRANDSYLRSTIFMYDDISLSDVRQAVDKVATTMQKVCLYEVDGNRYIKLLKWSDYQKQREDRIQKSPLPQPNQDNVVQMSDRRLPDDLQMSAQVKLDKIKLSKVSVKEMSDRRLTTHSPPNPYSSLDDLTPGDFEEISQHYQVPIAFVRSKYEDMCLWVGEKTGRERGRNWKLTLMSWVKRDGFKIKERSMGDLSKRATDARDL